MVCDNIKAGREFKVMRVVASIFSVSIIAIMSALPVQAEIVSTELLDKRLGTEGNLAEVAHTGSYNNLSDKPTIPTVNNATLTIQQNGTTVKTFTANSSTNTTANITVPTKTSELTNDSNFATTTQVNAKVSTNQGTANAGKGLVVNGTSGNLELQDIATQAELNSVSGTASSAKTTADSALSKANAAVVANTAITAGTGTKITYDAKGLVTGSAALSESDIPTLSTAKVSGLGSLATKSTVANGDISASAAIAPTKIAIDTVASYEDIPAADKDKHIPSVAVAEAIAGATADAAVLSAVTNVGNTYQVKSTANYQMGKSGGGWTTMSADQQNALNSKITAAKVTAYDGYASSKQDKATAVTHTADTAAGDATHPVYVTAAGVATKIDKVAAAAAADTATKATNDGSNRNIVSTYATKTEMGGKVATAQGDDNAKKVMATNSAGTVVPASITGAGSVSVTIADTGAITVSGTDNNTVTTATTTGTGNVVSSVTASNGALTVTKGVTAATPTDVTNAINALDVAASTAAGNVVTNVSQTDGKIAVTRGTITSANNPTVTIKQGGTTKGTFTLNQTGAATIELTDNNTTYTASGSNGVSASVSGSAISVSGTAATRDTVGVAKLGVIPVGTTGTSTATIWVE